MAQYDFEGRRFRLSGENIEEDENLRIADDYLEKEVEEIQRAGNQAKEVQNPSQFSPKRPLKKQSKIIIKIR